MRMLICAFVVCIWHKQVLSWTGSYWEVEYLKSTTPYWQLEVIFWYFFPKSDITIVEIIKLTRLSQWKKNKHTVSSFVIKIISLMFVTWIQPLLCLYVRAGGHACMCTQVCAYFHAPVCCKPSCQYACLCYCLLCACSSVGLYFSLSL